MPSKTLAHAQIAKLIEQNVLQSKDKVPIVLHYITLNTVTNVKIFLIKS